jgi:DNA polymerase-3 subunit delta'
MELHFDVAGAEGPKRYFGNLARGSLAHAYLFTGAPGVGKKTFARRLAQSLLCHAPKETVLEYDGTCSSCTLFSAGENARHPDFLEHDGALRIGDSGAPMGFYENEEITARDVVRLLSLRSYSGGMRVLLLGDVEFASPPAANALLKFLEEPPGGVVLLLTTATPGRLLPTIRSRLIEVRFAPLSRDAVNGILRRQGFGKADADLGSALGGGSVTRARAALEDEEESLRAQVARWFFESVKGNASDHPWASRETLDEGLQTIKTLVRDWVVAAGVRSATIVSVDYEPRIRRLPPLPAPRAVELLAKLDDAARLASTNVSPAMVAEIVRMALTGAGKATDNP